MLDVGGLRRVDVDRVLVELASEELTYPEVGATVDDVLPDDYHHLRTSVDLGAGTAVWERARQAVACWVPQQGAGAVVQPNDTPRVGLDVVVMLGTGPLVVIAPCRVVATFDEPDRSGFAYGTLPGHPEQGEEAFLVRRNGDRVRFEITAFSRPSGLAALAEPLSRRVQHRVTSRYLRAVADYVNSGPA